MERDSNIQNKSVIEYLAETYRQLFVAPGPGAGEMYLDIVGKGHEPGVRDLSHFITSDKDRLTYEETPAGAVAVITLGKREDFITFLRIMANRCEMVDIPDTQGAAILDGVINWRKIEQHREEFLKGLDKKRDAEEAWEEEFMRFTSDRRNFKDSLIILSVGPYSAVQAAKLGLSDDELISLSDKIRRYHECTHFICRKLYPDKVDAIWDELVADAAGIMAAFGRFDPETEKLFLGIEQDRYIRGRLENYADVDTDLLEKIIKTLDHIQRIISENPDTGLYELVILLEEEKELIWK